MGPHHLTEDGPQPALTIVVPSFQRCARLGRLLESIDAAVEGVIGHQSEGQVGAVVVLDGSTDGSMEMIRARSAPRLRVDVVWQRNAGLAAARNRGVAVAPGALVWLVDDDMVVSAVHWTDTSGMTALRAPVMMGPCRVVSEHPDVAHAVGFYGERHARLAVSGEVVSAQDCSFANTSAPARLLRDHPFDESFRGYGVEDFELATRLLAEGIGIAFDPCALVDHESRMDRVERRHKLQEEGRNRIRFLQLHPTQVDVVLSPDPGLVERNLRILARPILSQPLFGTSRAAGWLAGVSSVGPMRNRLATWSDLLAVYSGVASSGGVSRWTRRRSA